MLKYFFISFLIAACVWIAFNGCTPALTNLKGSVEYQPVVSGEAEEAAVIPADTILFDPLSLGDDGIFIPRPLQVADRYQGMIFIEEDEAEEVRKDSMEVERDTTSVWEEQVKPGFRVQIFASNDVTRAREIEQLASQQFPAEGVYLVYDPPSYKVRVGNCAEKIAADALKYKVIKLGYRDAWVVKDNIIVNVKVIQNR